MSKNARFFGVIALCLAGCRSPEPANPPKAKTGPQAELQRQTPDGEREVTGHKPNVAFHDDIMVVGKKGGAATVYRRRNGEWVKEADLTPPPEARRGE